MAKSTAVKSLAAVARLAGVSAMTVSRVLRNSPLVTAKTRKTVLNALKRSRYRPDPQIVRLMGVIRARKVRGIRSVIGFIRDDIPEDELHDLAYQYHSIANIRDYAARYGYLVEEFFLGRSGITPNRLGQILRSRGVEGIIVSPQSSRLMGAQFDYSPFAAATLGYGLPTVSVHRASTNMTQGILDATEELHRRGYSRVGLAITPWIDARSNYTYSGALLHYQQNVPANRRVPLLLFPENRISHGARVFLAWFKRHRPDAVITFDAYVPDWLTGELALGIPKDVGVVVHDWTPRMTTFAGIDHRRPHVAAAAVDLVVTQLMQNQCGVTEVPRQVLIPPRFVAGASIRNA